MKTLVEVDFKWMINACLRYAAMLEVMNFSYDINNLI